MNLTRTVLAVGLGVFLASSALADPPDLAAIAESFTPSVIIDEIAQSRNPHDTPTVVYMTAALDGPGTPEYLIAAYGGTETGAIRVISLAQPPSLVDENDVAGRLPELEAMDVDADGKPEIVASFDFGRGGSTTWVFRWADATLVNISPRSAEASVDDTELFDAAFEDLDGDGDLEAITSGRSAGVLEDGDDDPVFTSVVYELGANGYTRSSRPMFFSERAYAGSPNREFEFALGRLDVAYRIIVRNGESSGADKVTNGRIEINGVTVIAPGDFALAPATLNASFAPQRHNVLTWTIDAPSNGTMFIAVEPVAPITPLAVSVFVDCVWDEGGGLFTASFGYENPNPSQRSFDLGPENGFTPGSVNRGQIAVFRPGRHEKEFWVQSNGEALTWTVAGSSATASLAHPSRCVGAAPGRRVPPPTETPAEPPQTTGIVPTRGLPAGGETVLIKGANLLGATSVRFGATEANILDRGTHFIVLEAPAGELGIVDVTVTTDGGTQVLTGAYTYADPLPVVTPVPPAGLNAVADGNVVSVTWSPGIAADRYEIVRRVGSGAWTSAGIVPASNFAFTDTPVAPDGMVLYRVEAIADGFPKGAGTATSPPSTADYANVNSDAYEALAETPDYTSIKAQHIIELRQAVNALRAAMDLPPEFDGPLTDLGSVQGTPVTANDFTWLLDAINDLRMQPLFNLPVLTFADPPEPGRIVKRADLQILRDALD